MADILKTGYPNVISKFEINVLLSFRCHLKCVKIWQPWVSFFPVRQLDWSFPTFWSRSFSRLESSSWENVLTFRLVKKTLYSWCIIIFIFNAGIEAFAQRAVAPPYQDKWKDTYGCSERVCRVGDLMLFIFC